MWKKIAALAALLAVFAFLSCSKAGNDPGSDKSGADSNDPEKEAGETTEARIYPDLEAVDFGGYEFTFLVRTNTTDPDWTEWGHRDISAEDQNGEIINDAVYTRNKKIEEKYNIAIKEAEVPLLELPSLVSKTVGANDDSYDAILPVLNQLANIAQRGEIINLFKAPNLDLEKPWWNQGCVKDLSIIGKLFGIQGDILIMDNDALEAMIFNKTLISEHELENPYDIVKSGEWTFGKLIEMSKTVSKDLNGDGKMYIKDDLFGCIIQADTNVSFISSGGEKICAKDENDYPMITFGNERCYRIMEAISDLMLDEDNVVMLHRYMGVFPIYDEQVKMFSENRALFSWLRMRIVERLRGMETDFGIIPQPKLDKSQEKYITSNNPHVPPTITIPRTASNLERTGMILEDLCAESRYTLQPAYYEINLRGKFVRDDDSQEMLDIILSNTVYDIGYIYDFGGLGGAILWSGMKKETNYASMFEKTEKAMQKAIDKTIEAYEKLED